jgi:hypothetical protein
VQGNPDELSWMRWIGWRKRENASRRRMIEEDKGLYMIIQDYTR